MNQEIYTFTGPQGSLTTKPIVFAGELVDAFRAFMLQQGFHIDTINDYVASGDYTIEEMAYNLARNPKDESGDAGD